MNYIWNSAKTSRKTLHRWCNQFYFDLDQDYRQTIFFAGTGRSGTTWISGLINFRNQYRDIFEPFNPRKIPICSHFKDAQYLRPEDTNESYSQPIEAILSGRIRSNWTDKYNQKIIASKRII